MEELEVELEEEVLEELVAAVKQPGFLHMLESAASSFMPRSRSRTSLPRTRSGGSGVGPVTPPPPAAPPAQPADYHPLQADASDSEAEDAGGGQRPQPRSDGSSSSRASPAPSHAAPSQAPSDADAAAGTGEAGEPPQRRNADGEFVMVDKDEALEAMAYYIAQCLVKHPEAQNMTPKQLQHALTSALATLKQSRFKRVCRVGRMVYRWSTIGWSAVQMYQNPWLVQAILTALLTFSRMGVRAILS